MEKFVVGAELKANSPIMVARNRIINNSSLIRHQTRQDDMLGLIFNAFNDWVKNKSWTTGKHSPRGTGIPVIDGLHKISGVEVYSTIPKKKASLKKSKT